MTKIKSKNLEDSISSYQSMFEHSRTMMEFVQENGMPVPQILLRSAQPALNAALEKALTPGRN